MTVRTTLSEGQIPLCVDLDGTLIRTDLLWETLVRLLAQKPYLLFLVPFWWLRGRAYLKQRLAESVTLDFSVLPYNASLLEYMAAAKREGRALVLVTASDVQLAGLVARHLGIFDEVIASDGKHNLRGANKATCLLERYGSRKFDYAGNSSVDLHVWAEAREAIVVNAGKTLSRRIDKQTRLGPEFAPEGSIWRSVLRLLRPHQWAKNLIVFVPLLTAHKIFQGPLLTNACLAALSFCLCASGIYILNDLLDLDADRHHEAKRSRPLASGELPLWAGLVLCPLLLAAGLGLTLALTPAFAALLGLYFVVTTVYSLRLKRVALLDVFILAGLYTLRLIGGHIATGVPYSAWLLVFSMFLFLSLALLKRFKELQTLRAQNLMDVKGRGYTADDLEFVSSMGVVSGYLAVLVLALYANSEQVVVLYHHPLWLLLACPLLLYWISRLWMLAHRGKMASDPVAFALTDWPSYAVFALVLAILWAGTRF